MVEGRRGEVGWLPAARSCLRRRAATCLSAASEARSLRSLENSLEVEMPPDEADMSSSRFREMSRPSLSTSFWSKVLALR